MEGIKMSNYSKQYEQAKKANQVRQRTPLFIKFEKKGDRVIGQFLGTSKVTSTVNEGEYNQYLFETDEGLVKFHLGTATDNEVTPVLVPGNIYCLEYLGKEDLKGGKRVNKFNLEEIGWGDNVDQDTGDITDNGGQVDPE